MSVEFLRAAPLFQGLTDVELHEIVAILREESQPGGATVFRSDQTCSELYLIRGGFVRLMDSYNSVLATLGPGSLLGEAEFLRGLAHNTSAVAASDVRLWALHDSDLRKLLQKRFSIGLRLSQNFGEQIAQLEDYLVSQLVKTPALDGLPHRVLWPMARSMQPRRLERGTFLYRSGEQAEGLYLLESGSLEMQPSPPGEGSSPAPSLVERGDLIGVLPLLTNKPHGGSAYAVADCLVWTLPADTFHSLGGQFPLLRRTLGQHCRSRLSAADQTQAVVRLAQTSLFANVEPGHLQAIARRLVLQHVPSGETLYRLGDSSDALFLVDDGEIELTAENERGVLRELARVGAGEYCGAMSFLTGDDRQENATAIRNTNLWVLNRADLEELVGAHPAIGISLDQAVSTRQSGPQASVDEERLRRFPLLANLNGGELLDVARHLRAYRFRQGEQIYRAGAPSDALYFVESGVVRLHALNGSGSWTRGEGEIFGEKAILSDEPYGQSASADTDLEVLYVEQAGLDALKSRLPTLAFDIDQILSQPAGEEALPGVPPRRAANDPAEGQAASPEQRWRERVPPDDLPPPPAGLLRENWFSALGRWRKVQVVVIALLVLYLVVVGALWLMNSAF